MTKTCGCGLVHDESRWLELPFVGYQDFPAVAELQAERLELRNCRCGSTLAIRVCLDGDSTKRRAA